MSIQADATITEDEVPSGFRYSAVTPLPEFLTKRFGFTEADLVADFDRESNTIRTNVYGAVAIHLPTVASLGEGAVRRVVSHEFDALLDDMRAHRDAWKDCLVAIIQHHQENNQ